MGRRAVAAVLAVVPRPPRDDRAAFGAAAVGAFGETYVRHVPRAPVRPLGHVLGPPERPHQLLGALVGYLKGSILLLGKKVSFYLLAKNKE